MKDSPLLDIAKEYEILEQHVEDIRRVSAYLTTGVWYQAAICPKVSLASGLSINPGR
jgi:hypothetical protein